MATTTTATTSTATSAGMNALAAKAATDAATASQKAAIQKLKTSLGVGSGVDVASLAQNLTDAERIPQENAINQKITKNESRISGYGAITYMLSNLKDSVNDLKNKSSFNSLTVSNTNTNALDATAGGDAVTGNYSVLVSSLSQSQKSISGGFASNSATIGNGSSFDLTLAGTNAGVNAGTINGVDPNTIDNISFGTNPAVNDFKNFSIKINGINVSLDPKPASTNLSDLAKDLQSQLRALPNGADLIVTNNGSSLSFSSATKSILNPTLSASKVIHLNPPGVAVGTTDSQALSISGISFGSTPSVKDFSSFEFTVAGNRMTIVPNPATPDVPALAADLQKQIRSFDGSNDISVTVNGAGTGFVFASASSRTIGYPFLTPNSFPSTPDGIVNAINKNNGDVTAALVNDGSSQNPYKIILTGKSGASQSFTMTSASNSLAFSSLSGYIASDAVVTVDGVTYKRNSNTLNDVIPGVTLALKATNISQPAQLGFTRDNTHVKDKITAFVTAYNDLQSILKETSDPKSTLVTYGATLVADSTVNLVRNQVKSMLLGVSSSPGANIGALWQIGISVDRVGVMSSDTTKLDSALNANYADVVKAFTGNQENQSVYSPASGGIAGDAFKSLSKLIAKTGPLVARSDGATKQNDGYQTQLTNLKTRMDALLARYTKQFANMDSLVGSINTTRSSLTSTFAAMNNTNNNK